MSPAQQRVFHMARAADPALVQRAIIRMRIQGRRDMPFLLICAALHFALQSDFKGL